MLLKFFSSFLLCCALAGCSQQMTPALDQEDARMAGFYCDYLLASGVSPGTGGESALVVLDTAYLNDLLVRHYLTLDRFSRRVDMYRRDPERWRVVVEQVRLNIRKKTG